MRDSWGIQKAVYDALSYNLAWAVYDEVPQRDPDPASHALIEPPYIVLGEGTERPDDTHDTLGTNETMLLHFWSRGEGSEEVKRMMGDADEQLHHARLSLDDGRKVLLTREMAEIIKEEAEEAETWRHGFSRYRVRTLDGILL